MKVFVFGIRGFPFIGGGAERHSEELYPRLKKHGYDITVLARTTYFDEWKGIKFKKIGYLNNRYLETMSHSILCSFHTLKKKPDLVHIHNMGACLLIPLFNMRGIKTVLTLHSFNYLHKKWGLLSKAILKFCESLGVNFANSIITVSKDMTDFIKKKYARNIPINHISNAVSKATFIKTTNTLRKYGVKSKGYALAVGRLTPEKGFDKLIQAYKIANPRFKLVIIGDGDTQYAKDLRREKTDNIVFTGFLCGDELAEFYSHAGLMILSSYNEGFPLVLLEALSYSLPIIASNIQPYKDMNFPSYRYYTVDDAKELAIKMQELFGVEFTKQQKFLYKNILENEYDWKIVTKKIKKIYDTL